MHATEHRPVEVHEPGQLSVFPTARQAPVHFERIELLIWLYMSAQLGEIVSGPELLKIGWDNKGQDGRRLNWNHPDRKTRDQHRHLVVGVFNKIRRVICADGQYTIDTTYQKRDGAAGWRLREITVADLEQLKNDGYHGAYHRAKAMLAERAALAAQAERPALEAPAPPESPADEFDEPIAESAADIAAPLPGQINGAADYQGALFERDGEFDTEHELVTAGRTESRVT